MSALIRTILLIGAGQLGSRYLQGLAKFELPLNIYVYDIHSESLMVAERRWSEVFKAEIGHKVAFSTALDSVAPLVDIAIVATTADVRPKALAEACKHSCVRYWILEKVLAQSECDLNEIQACINTDGRAWVNTPRRMMPWHQQIRSQLCLTQPMTLKVAGGSWGLACNSVHFLDLLSWWSGETLQEVKTGRLDSNWFQSKRPGNWEIGGTLEARFSGGSRALLIANAGGSAGYSMQVSDGKLSWEINEALGFALRSDGISIGGRLPYQSEMSADLVAGILATGECALPTLLESTALHRVFIRSMQEHWQRTGHPDATFVPIT